MTVISEFFGACSDGRAATRYRLVGEGGIEAHVSDYGSTLVSLIVPDHRGVRSDVVVGYDSVEEYQRQSFYCGGLVGRYANRIAGGQFELGGKRHQLTLNQPPNHLHGGNIGFDRRNWREQQLEDDAVTLSYTSPAGEEGYPGTLTASVTYRIVNPFTLRVELRAASDQPTIVNLTSHTYFNLAGGGDILGHELTVPAERYTPVDAGLIPTGELRKVEGTPFDFRVPAPIGARIHEADPQLKYGQGYDHNLVIKAAHSRELVLAARLADPLSGRVLEIYSTHPGLQLYSGNYLGGGERNRDGTRIPRHGALALEPHNFPDAPNHPHFPSAVITPETPYHAIIEYRFGLTELRR